MFSYLGKPSGFIRKGVIDVLEILINVICDLFVTFDLFLNGQSTGFGT